MKKKWIRYPIAQEANRKRCTNIHVFQKFKSSVNKLHKLGFPMYIVNICLAKMCIIIPCASLVSFFHFCYEPRKH
jgi:hypothetical protein